MFNLESDSKTDDQKVKKINPVDFLKLASATIVSGVFLNYLKTATADIWQPEIIDLGIEILEKPQTIKLALVGSIKFLEESALQDKRAEGAPIIETNPLYKPMIEIIGDVLDKRRKLGKPITYQRVSDFEKLSYYMDKVKLASHDSKNRDRSAIESGQIPAKSYVLGYMPGTLTNIMYQKDFFPENVQRIWDMSSTSFFDLHSLAGIESGFLDQLIEKFGENWQTHENQEIKVVLNAYFQEIKLHIEKLVEQRGGPVSAGEIFSYCMDKNNGNINKSLFDTMNCLKNWARDDISLNNPNENWFKKNILDEYGKVGNYSKLPTHQIYPYNGVLSKLPGLADPDIDEDLHLLNQIGRYHSWNLAFILTAVPATMAQIGVAWRQEKTFSAQGSVKTAVIFRTALEANKLESLFMEYSKN